MGELVPIIKGDPEGPLYEAAADVYVELLDTKPMVKLTDVVDAMRDRWPSEYRPYTRQQLLGRLQTKVFSEYLTERRVEHLKQTMACRLLAAEFGARLGSMALQELHDRLLSDPESIRAKELLDIADRMVAWSEKATGQITEVEDSQAPRVEGNSFTQILMNVPPERAEAIAAELARRAIKQGREIEG